MSDGEKDETIGVKETSGMYTGGWTSSGSAGVATTARVATDTIIQTLQVPRE